MKNSLLKKLTVVLAIMLVAVLLAGCAKKAPEATPTVVPVTDVPVTDVPVTDAPAADAATDAPAAEVTAEPAKSN